MTRDGPPWGRRATDGGAGVVVANNVGERLATLEQKMEQAEKKAGGHEIRITEHEARIDAIEHDKAWVSGGVKAFMALGAVILTLSSYVVVNEIKTAKREVLDSVNAIVLKGRVP